MPTENAPLDKFRELPSELVDHILDLLAPELIPFSEEIEQAQTLARCSLVCKAWLPRSSHHLFRIVRFHKVDLAQKFAFAAASPRLATHVHGLAIAGSIDTSIFLGSIYSALPHLTYLQFVDNERSSFALPQEITPPNEVVWNAQEDLNHRSHSSQTGHGARSGVYTIRQLSLSHINAILLPYYLRLFSHITILELGELDMSSVAEFREGDTLEAYLSLRESFLQLFRRILPLSAPVEVDTLGFSGYCGTLAAAVASLIPFRPRRIIVAYLSRRTLLGLLCYLRDSGRNVEHVCVIVSHKTPGPIPNDHDPRSPDQIVLLPDSCPQLHTVHLDIRRAEGNSRRCRTALWYLPSASLRVLRIVMVRRQLVKTLRDIAAALRAPGKDYRGLLSIELWGLGNENLKALSPRSLAIINQVIDEELREHFKGEVVVFPWTGDSLM